VSEWNLFSNNAPFINNIPEIAFQVIFSQIIKVMSLLMLLLLRTMIIVHNLYTVYFLPDNLQSALHII
jgi:hypothetical protein